MSDSRKKSIVARKKSIVAPKSVLEMARGSEGVGEEVEGMQALVESMRNGQNEFLAFRDALMKESTQKTPEDLELMAKWFLQLKSITWMASLEDAMLRKLCKSMTYSKVMAGTTLCDEGVRGDTFFIIIRGIVSVTKRSVGDLNRLTVGAYFGEKSLLEDGHMAASILADNDGKNAIDFVEVAEVDRESFMDFVAPTMVLDMEYNEKRYEDMVSKRQNGAHVDDFGDNVVLDEYGRLTIRKPKMMLRRFLKKVYNVVGFLMRMDRLLFHNSTVSLWKNPWAGPHAVYSCFRRMCRAYHHDPEAASGQMLPPPMETPRRVVTRSRQVLRKAETLRTQEERGLLYRLVARHWDLSLSQETESSPDHDEVSSAMRIRVYHLPTSASNATSSTTARIGGGSENPDDQRKAVFRAGDTVTHLYVVLKGEVMIKTKAQDLRLGMGRKLDADDQDVVRVVKAGQCIGGPEYINEDYTWSCSVYMNEPHSHGHGHEREKKSSHQKPGELEVRNPLKLIR
jgi:CRP-like cAMP-binding protein